MESEYDFLIYTDTYFIDTDDTEQDNDNKQLQEHTQSWVAPADEPNQFRSRAKPSKKSPRPSAGAVGNYGVLAPSPTILKRPEKKTKSKRDIDASKKIKTKRTTEKSKKEKKKAKPIEPGIYVTNIPKELTGKAAKFGGRKTLPSLPTIERSREKIGGLKSSPGAKKDKGSREKSAKRASIERDKSKKPAINRDKSRKPSAEDRDKSKKPALPADRDKSRKPSSEDKPKKIAAIDRSAKSQKSKKAKATSKQAKPKDTKKSVDRYMVLTKIGEVSGAKKTPKKVAPSKRPEKHGSVVVGNSLVSIASPTTFPKQNNGVAPPDDEDEDAGAATSYKSKARSKRPIRSERASTRAASKRILPKKTPKKLATTDVQSTFDFVTSKYGKKASEDAAKRRKIMVGVGAVVTLMLLVFIIIIIVVLRSRSAGDGTDASAIDARSTTTESPPFEIAIPVDYATATTTPGKTVAWTPAAKRPKIAIEALKTACGECWYHPYKYTTTCDTLECHSLELFVGQGVRGKANHSFAFIKYLVPSTRRWSFVPEGAPCLTPGRQRVGVCSGRACLDIDNPAEHDQFEKFDTNPKDGQWTGFAAFDKSTKSCFSSNTYYTLASQFLEPKYTDLRCSSTDKCFPFAVTYRSCTKQKPANGGKHCFETETANNWLRMSRRTSPVIIVGCTTCTRWPSHKPLDFRPDCGRRFGDEHSCPSAIGDWTAEKGGAAEFAVSDFEYCCNGNELGRCLLGTCMPYHEAR